MSKPQISEQQITDSIVAALQQRINQLPKQPEIPESGIPPLNLREIYKNIIESIPVTLPPATSREDEILPLLPPMAEKPSSSLLPLLAVGAILLLN